MKNLFVVILKKVDVYMILFIIYSVSFSFDSLLHSLDATTINTIDSREHSFENIIDKNQLIIGELAPAVDTLFLDSLLFIRDSLEKEIVDFETYKEQLASISKQLIDTTRYFNIINDSISKTELHKEVLRNKKLIYALRAKHTDERDSLVKIIMDLREELGTEVDESKKSILVKNELAAKYELRAFEDRVGLTKLNQDYLPTRSAFLQMYNNSGRNRLAGKVAKLTNQKSVIIQKLKLFNLSSIQKELKLINDLISSKQDLKVKE